MGRQQRLALSDLRGLLILWLLLRHQRRWFRQPLRGLLRFALQLRRFVRQHMLAQLGKRDLRGQVCQLNRIHLGL